MWSMIFTEKRAIFKQNCDPVFSPIFGVILFWSVKILKILRSKCDFREKFFQKLAKNPKKGLKKS